MPQNVIEWIDAVKGYCMISVYLIHSEAYYGNNGNSLFFFFMPFYVNAFFFISGYLFFLKNYNHHNLYYFDSVKHLSNILFRLIVPTIIFSTLFYIPKMFFHHNDVSISNYFIIVFGGISLWFTSALAIAQLLLVFFMSIKKNTLCILILSAFLLFMLGIFLNNNRHNAEATNYLPWYWRTGIVYLFIMVLGGIYSLHENIIDSFARKCLPLIGGIYIYIMFMYKNGTPMQALGMGGQCNLFGLFCMILGTILIVSFSKEIHSPKFIRYIGRNSIVFYFFSGVYPAFISFTAHKYRIFNNIDINILAISIIAVLLGLATTWFVKNYCIFLIDIRKII